MSHYVYLWECQCGCGNNEYIDDKTAAEDEVPGYCVGCENEESRTAIIQLLAYDQYLVDDK